MKKIKRWWERKFLVFEFLTAVGLFLGFTIWSVLINKGVAINNILSGNRQTLYGTLAALFGSLLGFTITAVSIVLGFAASEKLEIVKKSKHYMDLWDIFKSAIKALGFATIFALLGLVFDKDITPVDYFLYINFFTAILSVFRIARCIWVLENIIVIVTKQKD
jgi:hypothetical protein